MATNKPHFRLTTYGKLNPGDLVWEPHWHLKQSFKIKEVKYNRNETLLKIAFTSGDWMFHRPTDKCFASW